MGRMCVATAGMINAQEGINALEATFAVASSITAYVYNARYFHVRTEQTHLVGKRIEVMYISPYSPQLI